MKKPDDPSRSVEKALKVLLAFRAERPSWGVRELSAHLGFSPATVQRLLRLLKGYSFVDQDPETRQYRLGNIYFNFIHVLQSTYPVTKAAKHFLKQLAERTRETVHFNMIEGLERICVDSIESPHNLRGSMPIGERSPLYAGASARCLLAFSPDEFIDEYLAKVSLEPLTENTIVDAEQIRRELARVRKQGYAASVGERTRGLASLSAPVFGHNGILLGTLSLALPELRFRDERHSSFCRDSLLDTAAGLSTAMTGPGGGARS